MNKKNGITVTLIILTIILLSLISFVGIYMKNTNEYENKIPNYILGMDIGKKRVVTLKVNDGTTTTIYDKDGKKVDSIPEGEDESKYKKEEKVINPEEVLTEENYKQAKKVMENRLNAVKADDYIIKYSTNTGDIIVELPENDNTTHSVNMFTATGKFNITSEETGEVLIQNSDLKQAKVAYYNGDSATDVYLIIELNKEGTAKLKDVTNTYVETVEKVTTKDKKTGKEKTEDKKTEKKVVISLDWTSSDKGNLEYIDLITQSFSQEIEDGTLRIKIGSATTQEKLKSYYNQGVKICSALNSGKSEIQYKIEGNEVIESEITNTQITVLVIVIVAISAIISIVMIIKYKILGLLGVISNISMCACMLLVVRLAKVIITLNSIVAVLAMIIANALIISNLIKKVKNSDNPKEAFWKGVLEAIDILVVLLIISVTFIFMVSEAIVSTGMVMFWGILSIIATNLLFTKPLILSANRD